MQLIPRNDPAPPRAVPALQLAGETVKPPRLRPSFESLLNEQVKRRRDAGLSSLLDIEAAQRERQKIQFERTAYAIKISVAQRQQETELMREAAFDEGAAYARKHASFDALFWVVTGTLLGGSLTWWLLRLGGSIAAGA